MQADFLFELGCEELPPKSLLALSNSLEASLVASLKAAELNFSKVTSYATPRRLAVVINQLDLQQPTSEIERLGPNVKQAYKDGEPTPAALGFAASCGVELSQLSEKETDKGTRLAYFATQEGKATKELLPEFIQTAINQLPIAKNMRWGARRTEFVRPVHWLIMLLGDEVLPAQLLGLTASRQSYGHRFHAPEAIEITSPASYAEQLAAAKVIASFAERKEEICQQVLAEAEKQGATAVIDADLLDEVTGLVELPVALTGSFDAEFLQVPEACLISSMQANQKYFHLVDNEDKLLPFFITLSNIASSNPQAVIAGNEKVIRPRLADAAFFYAADQATPLAARFEQLEQMVFQKDLGTLADKSRRVAKLAAAIAQLLDSDPAKAEEAASLYKCDLTTEMVQEFPELQGIMGHTYAKLEGKDAEVSLAIEEHYLPRNPKDALPSSNTGIALALADRLDTLTGIFGLGLKPTGMRDPFALRRAALAVLNILVNKQLNLDLRQLIQLASQEHNFLQKAPAEAAKLEDELLTYLLDRFRAWYQNEGLATEIYLAVRKLNISQAYDFNLRVKAVAEFSQLKEASQLAAANKRAVNILARQKATLAEVKPELLTEAAEKALYAELTAKQAAAKPLLEARTSQSYSELLASLVSLEQPLADFFEKVQVVADDEAVKANRLALLSQLAQLFGLVADISELDVK